LIYPKSLSYLLLLSSFVYANLFTITDKKGHIFSISNIKANNNNHFLKQKSSEYSIQAFYDELHKERNLAFLAEISRQRALRIAKEKAKAKKEGKHYHISQTLKQKLLQDAKMFKGGRYIWGGASPSGFDCSGYVQYLYKKQHINLPRTALEQSKIGITVPLSQVKKGDLLFFLTDKSRAIPITHVGIYLGDGTFIHAASSKKGIIISPLYSGHYSKLFVLAKRILKNKGFSLNEYYQK